MSNFVIGLFSIGTWEIIFASFFFFGLFFFILAILSSFGDEDADVESDADGEFIDLDGDGIPDGVDLNGDGSIDFEIDSEISGNLIDLDGDGIPDGIDLTGNGSIDVEFEAEFSSDISATSSTNIDSSSDMSSSMDRDPFDHIEINSLEATNSDEKDLIFLESKYKIGEYAMFSMFYGMVGWFYTINLQDIHLIIAFIFGYLAMKSFAYIIANYAQTVIVPVKGIRRGDVVEVRYTVLPEKSGVITIFRKDGVLATEMARGAFPHDRFTKGERGYVWGKTEKGIYLITKGIIGQPDLQNTSDNLSPKLKNKGHHSTNPSDKQLYQ